MARIEISLNEYETLIENIKKLEETNDNYEDFLFYKKELERKLNNAIFVSYLQEMVVLPISSTDVR